MLSRRRFFAVSGAALAGVAGVGLYSWQVEPHWVQVVRRPMPLPDLPLSLAGRTLLQLSDIHVGPRVSSDYLIHALRSAAALEPDFVVFTGDFVSYRSARVYRELARVLRALPRGRLATVAALGNHDYGPGWRRLDVADAITRVASDAGAIVLRNEVRIVGGIQFVGLADLWSPEFGAYREAPLIALPSTDPDETDELAPAAPSGTDARHALDRVARDTPTIALAHNPDAQDLPIWGNFKGWVLAGHTHGGQVKPPFLPPPVLPVRNKRYTAGAFAVAPGRTLYINRGLGHLLQVRFNVRPELTLFTLEREHASPINNVVVHPTPTYVNA
jgi:predicted MPP superfamily phosphohydrolase